METKTIRSYCKFEENTPIIEFGNGSEYFNGTRSNEIIRSTIRKQFTDSLEIKIEVAKSEWPVIPVFKLTNQLITTWDDYWVSDEDKAVVDPRIVELNLQRNKLIYVNMSTPRSDLQILNLEGNSTLSHFYLHNAKNLKRLDISGCSGLRYITLGLNRSIQELIAKDCKMSSDVLEQLLRDFTPTITASANMRGAGIFRKQHSTVLDLRGNVIDWSNPRIASKIRLLLTNNWIVKWDNNPPSEIVPPILYRFFVESRL